MDSNKLLLVAWNSHLETLKETMFKFHVKETFCDCTIVCEGEFFLVHKFILANCSNYFYDILERAPCKHPYLILSSVTAKQMSCLLQYMYEGELHVSQEELPNLIKAAKNLGIKGLGASEKKDRTPFDSKAEENLIEMTNEKVSDQLTNIPGVTEENLESPQIIPESPKCDHILQEAENILHKSESLQTIKQKIATETGFEKEISQDLEKLDVTSSILPSDAIGDKIVSNLNISEIELNLENTVDTECNLEETPETVENLVNMENNVETTTDHEEVTEDTSSNKAEQKDLQAEQKDLQAEQKDLQAEEEDLQAEQQDFQGDIVPENTEVTNDDDIGAAGANASEIGLGMSELLHSTLNSIMEPEQEANSEENVVNRDSSRSGSVSKQDMHEQETLLEDPGEFLDMVTLEVEEEELFDDCNEDQPSTEQVTKNQERLEPSSPIAGPSTDANILIDQQEPMDISDETSLPVDDEVVWLADFRPTSQQSSETWEIVEHSDIEERHVIHRPKRQTRRSRRGSPSISSYLSRPTHHSRSHHHHGESSKMKPYSCHDCYYKKRPRQNKDEITDNSSKEGSANLFSSMTFHRL